MFLPLLTVCLLGHVFTAEGSDPVVLTKGAWGGRTEGSDNFLITPIPFVIIHHTVTPECNTREECTARVRNIQNYHMDGLGWDDIGYNFIVGGDGNVYEGVGWTQEGAHTYGYNKKSVCIAFIGNFTSKKASRKMLNAAHSLIRYGVEKEILRDSVCVIGARQVQASQSPGSKLYTQIQAWPEWCTRVES